jgi:hypothetical protein
MRNNKRVYRMVQKISMKLYQKTQGQKKTTERTWRMRGMDNRKELLSKRI